MFIIYKMNKCKKKKPHSENACETLVYAFV